MKLIVLLWLLVLPVLAQAPQPSPMPETMPVDFPEDPGSVVPS